MRTRILRENGKYIPKEVIQHMLKKNSVAKLIFFSFEGFCDAKTLLCQ